MVGAVMAGVFMSEWTDGLLGREPEIALMQFTIAGSFPIFLWLARLFAPKTIKRTAGRRRTLNFRLLSRIYWLLVFALCGAIIWFTGLSQWQILIGILGLAWGGNSVFDYAIRRQEQPSVEEKTANDSRPPVLYLRSFAAEGAYFWTGYEHQITWATGPVGLASNGRLALTFPEFFGKMVEQEIGPFVGLGNPEDWLPSEGLATTYYKDEGWEQHVERLMDESAFIFIQVGRSANLRFELDLIVEKGYAPKTLILLKPRPATGFFDKLDQFFIKIMGRETVKWADFEAGMTAAGFKMPPAEPPPGSLVVFDELNSATVLDIDGRLPGDFVAAILERADN